MQKIACWRLESLSDSGCNALVARFASPEEAAAAKSKAGGYGPEILKEEITVYDTAIEAFPDLDREAVKSGLEKLTDRERRALGIRT